ncbi:exo-alpha-sialidase [Sphingobacterium phlebotomi]|uniref:Exo-alpha-sialidase n=1 Tax=Sphingobacterium phlebotomi TaxID=2605433 RepID=A0A5D4HBF9_9SPHI|nr:sialidase family protein [Sphingobacterium phlebotomi]TYR37533.1 exo-alpha-sialidase [Sphingobacterium phlebotomi]
MKIKNAVLGLLLVACNILYVGLSFGQISNPFPGTVVFESKDEPIKKKVASPGIVILSNGNYLISHDFDRGTSIHVSKNKGKTWKQLSKVSPLIWANIFEHKGDVYLMGTTKGWGDIVIYKSRDNGKTWSVPVDEHTGILAQGLFHTGPVPIVKHRGKIWRAYEEAFDPENRRDFHALAIAADEDADLLKASSWKRTNSIRFEEKWLNAKRPNWLEGNLVVTPDGKLVDFMRLETWTGKGVEYEIEGAAEGKTRNEIAAIIDIDDKNVKMEFRNERRNFVHFPGAETKFTIRYDSVSKQYWTITNKISSFKDTEETYNGNWHQRNVLILMSSKDLHHWEIRKKILRYNEGAHLRTWDTFGFQYIDWVFDDRDIIFASRTSWYGFRYHDANMITFHRVEDFRNSSAEEEPEDLKKYTEHPQLIDVPVGQLSEANFVHEDFDFSIHVGKGLKQSSPGTFDIVDPKRVARNFTQTLKWERYFDIKLLSAKRKNFSLETLGYTPVTDGNDVKLKWEYSIDGKKFFPITNYYIPVENGPDESAPEPALFLQVYRMLNNIQGNTGVTIRCHVINMKNTPAYLKFNHAIQFGGRKL